MVYLCLGPWLLKGRDVFTVKPSPQSSFPCFCEVLGWGGMCGPSRLLWEGTENKPFLQPGESIYLEVVGEQMDGFS